MDDETAGRLMTLTADLIMVFGRMKRFAHVSDRDLVHPGTEFAILDAILRQKCRTVPEIASSRGVTRQSVQAVVNKILEHGTLVYVENPSHKNSKYLHVTPDGLALYEDIKMSVKVHYLRSNAALRKGDLDAAARVMAVIADTWALDDSETIATGSS